MYVCICKAVSDKQIAQAIEAGAESLQDVQQELGVGSQCGKCVNFARKVIQQQNQQKDANIQHMPDILSPMPA